MVNLNLITPSALMQKHPDQQHTLKELRALANAPDKDCDCGLPVWKYAGLGMCFTCVTGESDSSEDYELIPEVEVVLWALYAIKSDPSLEIGDAMAAGAYEWGV